MSVPLLTTKLFIPAPRANLVPRPGLIQELDEGLRLGHRLTLVSAPAGFGKTTLVSDWLRQMDGPTAWLSLDDGDNDPARFLAYLYAALENIDPGIEPAAAETLPLESLLNNLMNHIAAMSQLSILVLDDYHAIEAATIHEIVSFLLDHLPSLENGLHLVVATRADPPLPLARLRARGQLTELHAVDLRFTQSEAAAYLKETMALALTAEHVVALERRTEGWITGLQLAALSLRRHENPASFVQAFTGSQRYVLDYLTEEVLNRQPAEIGSFLLHTAILDTLSGSLCDAVTRGTESQSVLELLDAANLFIVPLDDERQWYRYHRLFADLLRQRLGRERPELVPELHRRASAWYLQEGLHTDAVRHLLAAGELVRAADLIDWIGWGMLARGEMRTLLGWLDTLPRDLVDAQPQLDMLRAWALALSGRWDSLGRAEWQGDDRHVPGEVDALHAYLAAVQGDVARTVDLCARAIELLPEEKWFSRSLVALSQGIAHFASGEPLAASEALGKAIALGRETRPTYTILAATSTLGHVQEARGALHEAAGTFQHAIDLAAVEGARPVPIAGVAYVGLAEVQYEWNDLDRALANALEGVELTEYGGFTSYLLAGHAQLVEIHLARRDLEEASRTLATARRLAHRHDYPYMDGVLAGLQVRLWVALGDLTAAREWLRGCALGRAASIDLALEARHLAAVRAMLALGHAGEALAPLARVLVAAEASGRTRSLIEILVLQALALQAQGDMKRSLAALKHALTLAEPEGYVRTFVDEGEPVGRLLRRAVVDGIATGYAGRVLAALNESLSQAAPAAQALVEPLTEREIEVLRLIAAGLSNPEIAGELVVAVSTVKSHINHIYGKLGVKNRMQAINRSRRLKLL